MKRFLLTIMFSGLFLAMLAGVPAYSAVPASDTETAMVSDEADSYTVILKEVGPNKVKVVKIIRSVLDIELKAAYDLVNAAPVALKTDADAELAQTLKNELEAAGATVEVKGN
ncbi:MAG: ribosomal protein L7/L12 [Bacteroidales bacterium]|nr:ribosomal protein L7/L12 [Bacteroidales bacterium]